MRFRSDRIWRLGEKELRAPHYWKPRHVELHDCLEDSVETPEAVQRYELGMGARQLTSVVWHAYWSIEQ